MSLTTGERIVGGVGLLLIIDLLALPWHSADLGFISISHRAFENPNGFYAVMALLLVIAAVARVLLGEMAGVTLPDPPVPWGQVHMIAGIAVLALLVLKFILETKYLGAGAYLGIILAAAFAFGGYTLAQEAPSRTTGPRLVGSSPVLHYVAILRQTIVITGTLVPEDSRQVIVVPPGVGGLNSARVLDLNNGSARPDGSFTAGRAIDSESRSEGIKFRKTADAVDWSESQGWTVINKSTLQ